MTTAHISKSEKRACEICGKFATLKCLETPTFYCSQMHFEYDWFGIRRLVFEETAHIRRGIPATASTRDERKALQSEFASVLKKVKTIAETEAKQNMISRRFELAISAGLEALKMTQQLHANESEMARCHLILAEANLGLGKLDAAEEFLNLAAANINEKSELTAQLQRSFGMLHRSQGKTAEAVRSFALFTYHTSVEFGTDSYQTALGYLMLGETFPSAESANSERMISRALDVYTKSFFWGNERVDGVEKSEVIDAIKKIKDRVTSHKEQTADCEGLLGVLTGEREHIDLAKLLFAECSEAKLVRINEIGST